MHDYMQEAGEMVVLPGSHLFCAEEGGKLVAWTLGHPASVIGRVFEGEKSFVPVAEYVPKESRGKVPLAPYWLRQVDALKEHGFDFFHLRPDVPFMTTDTGRRLADLRSDTLQKRRGLKSGEGFYGNALCFDAERARGRIEQARQKEQGMVARQQVRERAAPMPKTWLGRLFRGRPPRRPV
jgi:hypothetical protein